MNDNWNPGDVALVEAGCWANHKVALRLDEGWAHINRVNLDDDGVVFPVRRLVVIDPEDREQIERLDDLLWATNTAGEARNDLQAALREFANPTPPKPVEPTGLGAVVEDAEGRKWVHVGPGLSFQVWAPSDADERIATAYDSIAAVRVLSEGVTP